MSYYSYYVASGDYVRFKKMCQNYLVDPEDPSRRLQHHFASLFNAVNHTDNSNVNINQNPPSNNNEKTSLAEAPCHANTNIDINIDINNHSGINSSGDSSQINDLCSADITICGEQKQLTQVYSFLINS